MRNSICKLATLWPDYLSGINEDSSKQAYQIIYKNLPELLSLINPDDRNLIVESSGGTGRVTAAPWFATFDKRVTTKPTEGLYVVFLFSVDMSSVVLQLGLGTTQFTNFHGKGQKALSLICNASSSIRQSLLGLIESGEFKRLRNKVVSGPSDLKTTKSNMLQKTYEQASIYHITYELNDNSMSTLEEDYLDMLRLYQRAINSEVIPEIDTLLCQTIDTYSVKPQIKDIEVKGFKARDYKNKTNSASTTKSYAYSNSRKGNTKLIGDLGEKVVLDYEINKLIAMGREDLAEKVVHEEALGNRPGWDISSFDDDGMPIQIEVKSSVSSIINNLVMTSNEWNAASQKGDTYRLYLVTGVNKNGAKKIEILKNPYKLNDSGEVALEVLSYQLRLSE